MSISQERFDAAQDAYIANIDVDGFANSVGLRQEHHMKTDMMNDLHGAFTVAVEEELGA